MIKNKQLFHHDPDNGIYGDCHRTAIACILNKQPEEVPHIGRREWLTDWLFHKHFSDYLKTQGLAIVTTVFQCDLETLLAHQAYTNPTAYYLLGGNSSDGIAHTVVGCGGEIVWDPAWDDSGIVEPQDNGLYWISYFTPLSTHKEEVENAGSSS